MRRPDFLAFALATVGALVWFYVALPESYRSADQILNLAILLGLLGLYLIFDFRPKFAAEDQGAPEIYIWGGVGALLVLLSVFLSTPLTSLFCLFVGTCCLARAAAGVLLDPSSRRLQNSLFVAFSLFGALLVSLPLLDMPLRILTGRWTAHLFEWLQNDTALGFVQSKGEPMLLLVVNDRPFHVAAECNGFGLLGTCILFTAAIIFYRRIGVLDALLLLIAAVFVAVVGNLVRILIIVSLAPKVGDHYMLMHEIVGTICFYGFLAIQWWLIVGFGKTPRPARTTEDG